jgi:chromatin remodeling complex protein RSC6
MKRRYKGTGPNRGHFNVTREMFVCPALAQIVCTIKASRGQIVKKVWDYIKAHKLQCKGRGRVFRPDARLSAVLGTKGMEEDGFKIMQHLEKHLYYEDYRKDVHKKFKLPMKC